MTQTAPKRPRFDEDAELMEAKEKEILSQIGMEWVGASGYLVSQ